MVARMPVLVVLGALIHGACFSPSSAFATCAVDVRTQTEIPAVLQIWVGQKTGYEGSNCYQSSLLAHYPHLAGRHVNSSELNYFLSRDFDRVLAQSAQAAPLEIASLMPGDVLVFDGAEHAAYYLGSGKVFDRPAWEAHYAYRIVPFEQAHTGMLPPVGGDPHDALLKKHEKVEPFKRMEVYRRKFDTATPVPREPVAQAVALRQLMIVSNKILKARFEPGDKRHSLVSLFSLRLIQEAAAEARKIVRPSYGTSAPFDVDESFQELYFELGSRLDGYDGYVKQYYFSSVYMTYDKFYREYASGLRASESRDEDVELLTAFLKARSLPAERGATDEKLRQAREMYPRIPTLP
jgi:hypothetical protein